MIDPERPDYVVCAAAEVAMPWDDNVFTNCIKCARRIQHRPHMPKAPPKICVPCAAAMGSGTNVVTRRTVDEVLAYLRSTRN